MPGCAGLQSGLPGAQDFGRGRVLRKKVAHLAIDSLGLAIVEKEDDAAVQRNRDLCSGEHVGRLTDTERQQIVQVGTGADIDHGLGELEPLMRQPVLPGPGVFPAGTGARGDYRR